MVELKLPPNSQKMFAMRPMTFDRRDDETIQRIETRLVAGGRVWKWSKPDHPTISAAA